MYCGRELLHKSHAYKHKKRCGREDRDTKTGGDMEDELRFLEALKDYNELTNDGDRKLFRSCVFPLVRLNSRPIGFNFKDSDEKTA